MKTIYSPEDLKTDSIVINLNDDTEIRIRINQFGELVVNKQYVLQLNDSFLTD